MNDESYLTIDERMTCENANVEKSAPLSAEIMQQYCITALTVSTYSIFYQRIREEENCRQVLSISYSLISCLERSR